MIASSGPDNRGLAWQIGVWDQISQIYRDEIEPRFEPVVDGLLRRAGLRGGQRVLDLGTGTGAVAAKAAALVADDGFVLAVDISPEMLDRARRRSEGSSARFEVREAAAEAIPAGENTFDAILASLSLMYVIDRAAAARELARVLRPGGRLVAAVWAGPESCDIVLFQQTAGRFAPTPPVPGVGPGALADVEPFLDQLADCGIQARVETEVVGFDFNDFDSAWDVLAGVRPRSCHRNGKKKPKPRCVRRCGRSPLLREVSVTPSSTSSEDVPSQLEHEREVAVLLGMPTWPGPCASRLSRREVATPGCDDEEAAMSRQREWPSMVGEQDVAASTALRELGADLRGELICPQDSGYDEVRTVFNGMIDRRPLVVVRCAGASDVVRGITFAREHGLVLSVRGGGHNVAGNAVCDGGMMLDLSA
ncbi:MAG: methyltransferase domain-containing protein [Pseudonocardiaceae bacterium]